MWAMPRRGVPAGHAVGQYGDRTIKRVAAGVHPSKSSTRSPVQLSRSSRQTGDPEHRAYRLVGDPEVAGNAAQPFLLCPGDNLWPAVLGDTPWLRAGGIAACATSAPRLKHALCV